MKNIILIIGSDAEKSADISASLTAIGYQVRSSVDVSPLDAVSDAVCNEIEAANDAVY